MKMRRDRVAKLLNCFFVVKGYLHYLNHEKIIRLYVNKPILFDIAKKNNMSVLQVHNIVREYKLAKLNHYVFLLQKES